MKGQQDGTSGASAAYYSIDQRSKELSTARLEPHVARLRSTSNVFQEGKGNTCISGLCGGAKQRQAQAYLKIDQSQSQRSTNKRAGVLADRAHMYF